MESDLPFAAGIPVHCAHHALVSVHDLQPHRANPNTHPERQLGLYAEAIRRHGWRVAIRISRRSGFIVSGTGAAEAAQRIPSDTVPVEYHDYGSEHEELADMLAHNRLADLLKTALKELGGAGCDLPTGFTSAAIAELLAEVAPLPQLPIAPRLNECHRLLCIAVDNETDWAFLKNLAGVRLSRWMKEIEPLRRRRSREGAMDSFRRKIQSRGRPKKSGLKKSRERRLLGVATPTPGTPSQGGSRDGRQRSGLAVRFKVRGLCPANAKLCREAGQKDAR